MVFKTFATVVSAAILSASLAQAQSAGQLGGPRNLPPPGFAGQQFVDSNGCVFLKAGFGGRTNWVPRVNASHRPLCGFPPTFGAQVAAAADASMAPDPQAQAPVVAPVVAPVIPRVAAPAITVAAPAPVMVPVIAPVVAAPVVMAPPAALQPVAAPIQAAPRRSLLGMLFGRPRVGNPIPLVPMTAPQPAMAPVLVAPVFAAPVVPMVAAQPAYVTASGTGQGQCFTSAPSLEMVLLRSGGTAMVCTRGDGTLTGWRSPFYPQGMVGAALSPHMMDGARLYTGGAPQPRMQTAAATTNTIPKPPKGYKLAWKDDRLNPMRGLGTARGQAQQDQVWTRDIPAELTAAPQIVAQTSTPPRAQARVAVSTMSAPAQQPQPVASGASYVQVGTFGQPANADGVRARLASMGLPVSTSKITRKGKVLQIVFAGPFGTTAEAQAALAATHGAGYADAILK